MTDTKQPEALPKFRAIDFINTEEELEAYVSGRMLGLQQGYDAARLEIEALRSRQCLHGISEPSGWMPIETAPKDGTLIVLGARNGVWLGKYLPLYGSGYRPENPWSSMLLNHDHMAERYTRPTHWMPLPPSPSSADEGGGK